MTTPHKQAEFLRALADGRGDEFECQHESWAIDVWRDGFVYAGNIYDHPENWTVRRKTKTIELAGVKFLEPMRVAPAIGKMYWLASPTKAESENMEFKWSGDHLDARWLKAGMCHLKREDAEQHRKALILVSGGTP